MCCSTIVRALAVARSVGDGFRDGFEGDFFGLFLGGFEFAIDSHVGVLIEIGIGFHARFGLGAASNDIEIVLEETDTPFESSEGVVVLECVRSALCLFDEFAVRYTSGRPRLREMVGVELQETSSTTRNTADDDVFLVMEAFFDGVHGTPVTIVALNRHNITHAASVGGGNLRMRGVVRNNAFQTVFYDRFQMSRHVL